MNVRGDFLASPHGTNTTGVVCKKRYEKSPGSATITNRSPSQTPTRKKNTKGDCKMQTLALEIKTPLNECTGRLSRISTRHKHNRRGMQKKGKRKVQGVPQSQTAALPRHPRGRGIRKVIVKCKLWQIYEPYLSDGFVSLNSDYVKSALIKILRDTRVSQSLILAETLPFSEKTYSGTNVLIQGAECRFV